MFGGDSHANDREDDDRKESKKDKGYVAFHSDDSDNLEEVGSEEHTSELQSRQYLVCRLLLEKKKTKKRNCIRYENLYNVLYDI